MSRRKTMKAIERVADEAGASVAFETTRKGSHVRVILTLNGRTDCTVISGTPSRAMGTAALQLRDVERTLRGLGYVAPVKQNNAKPKPRRAVVRLVVEPKPEPRRVAVRLVEPTWPWPTGPVTVLPACCWPPVTP